MKKNKKDCFFHNFIFLLIITFSIVILLNQKNQIFVTPSSVKKG